MDHTLLARVLLWTNLMGFGSHRLEQSSFAIGIAEWLMQRQELIAEWTEVATAFAMIRL